MEREGHRLRETEREREKKRKGHRLRERERERERDYINERPQHTLLLSQLNFPEEYIDPKRCMQCNCI